MGAHSSQKVHDRLPSVVDDRNAGAVNEAYSGTLSEACEIQQHRHGYEAPGHALDEAIVENIRGELSQTHVDHGSFI